MKVVGSQILAARVLLGLTQGELARAAAVALSTIVRFETGKAAPYPASVEKLAAELERRGIEFTNGDGIGVRLNYAKAAEFTRATAQYRAKHDQ
jgi:transcriptional regulator with XRE-family HTH domain